MQKDKSQACKSDIGQFLAEFDKKPEATNDARAQEEAKHKNLHNLRDNIQDVSDD